MELCLKNVAKGGVIATYISLIHKHMVVHRSQILCCPVAWILELVSLDSLSLAN